MKAFFCSFLLITSFLVASENYKKLKVYPSSKGDTQLLANMGFDHFWKDRDGGLIIYASETEYSSLSEAGFQTEVLIDDWYEYYNKQQFNESSRELNKQLRSSAIKFGVNSFDFGSMGGYYILDEVYSKLDEMYANFPALITEKQSIGITNELRDIYYVKISDNPSADELEPEVLYTALHHAREPEGMMQMIYFMYYLLENYGSNPEVTYLVDNRELYFIPVVNPDGYEENRRTNPNGGGMHRKNMRENSDGSTGVDLNRNYGPIEYWNAPNGGSSSNPSNITYRGTAPFSEPETAAIRQFLIDHEIAACLNYHTYGNLLIYPYGALEKETPDSIIFREFASDMTRYNNYNFGTDGQTVGYSTRGNSDDYFYDGEVDLKGKVFAMTPEVGSGSDGFWPSQSRIIPLAEENIFPNLYYAWIVGGYVVPTDLSLSSVYVTSGSSVLLSIGVKNKGLENFESFSIQVSSNSDAITFIDDNITVNELGTQEEILLNDILQFEVDISAIPGTTFDIYVTTFKNDVAMFTKSYSFRIGEPIEVFVSQSSEFDQEWNSTSNVSKKWEITKQEFFSDSTSITDSPIGNYLPNSNVSLELKSQLLIPDSSLSLLTFNTKFEIENGWDYGQVLVSTNAGSLWLPLSGKYSVIGSGDFQPIGQPVYSGRRSEWSFEEIELNEYAGNEILLKFQLNTDEYVEMDGWYLDDIKVVTYNSNVTSLSDESNTLTKFYLSENYPNPFNPSTTIMYSVPSATGAAGVLQHVNLSIYNSLGELITTLVNSYQKPGNYRATWTAGKLNSNFKVASGIYFYSLSVGEQRLSKKMLLLK